jgi:hypothetical protein
MEADVFDDKSSVTQVCLAIYEIAWEAHNELWSVITHLHFVQYY